MPAATNLAELPETFVETASMPQITTLEELQTLYGRPLETAIAKEVDRIIPAYAQLIAASPFAVLASSGPEGLDCSPRGDQPGFALVRDERTLLIPDRRGNNRVDSLRNIIRDPRVALLFLIPGSGTTLRVNGKARLITDDADILSEFTVEHRQPRSVIVIAVEAVHFQCARAIERAKLWDPLCFRDPSSLPTPGQMLACVSDNRIGGVYDRSWRDRALKTLW